MKGWNSRFDYEIRSSVQFKSQLARDNRKQRSSLFGSRALVSGHSGLYFFSLSLYLQIDHWMRINILSYQTKNNFDWVLENKARKWNNKNYALSQYSMIIIIWFNWERDEKKKTNRNPFPEPEASMLKDSSHLVLCA